MTANCETCKHLQGIACTHPELERMPYEKGCSYWEAVEEKGKDGVMAEFEYGDFCVDQQEDEWLVIDDGIRHIKYPIIAMKVSNPRTQGFFTVNGISRDDEVVLTKKKQGSQQGIALEKILKTEAEVFVGQSPAIRRDGRFSDEFISHIKGLERICKPTLTAEEIKRGILSKPALPNETRFDAIFEQNKARWQEGRRIIQAGSHEGALWVLCADGTLWFREKDHWLLMPPIPSLTDEHTVLR